MKQVSEVTEPTYDSVNARTKQSKVQVCLKHGKQIEAFCLFDRQLLCIDCILSDEHKGEKEKHDIVSVQKAAVSEKESLENKHK